jgi:hypothetical protein
VTAFSALAVGRRVKKDQGAAPFICSGVGYPVDSVVALRSAAAADPKLVI